MRSGLIIVGVVSVAALSAFFVRRAHEVPTSEDVAGSSSTRPPPTPPASSNRARPGREGFVGSAACAPCHRAESDASIGSHHAKALVMPGLEMAKERFDGSHFASKLGGTTKFAVREGGPVAITPAAGGRSRTFPIRYVSGVWPLEQYIVATERGKLQSLGVVWDSRTATEGGNRWFHVYGARGI